MEREETASSPAGQPPGPPSGRRGSRGWWKRLLLIILFLGFTFFAVSQFTSAQMFAKTMGAGVWYWGLISVAIFAAYFYLFAVVYKIGLETVDVPTTSRHMLPVLLGSIFINTVVPIGATAGAAVFVEDAVEHRLSGARTAAGVILVLAVDLITAIPFIVAGLAVLGVRGTLQAYHVVVTVLFLGFIGIMIAGLWMGKTRKPWLHRFLGFFQRAINRIGRFFRHPGLITDAAVSESAAQFSDAAGAMIRRPALLAKALLVALLMHAVNEVGLYALFLTYHQNVDIGTLTAGMGMSIVFLVIAITPQGAGAVEGVMSLLFSSVGVASDTAIVVAISYRVLNVWIPLALGYFFIRKMKVLRGVIRPNARRERDKGD
ncbi:MAG: flippase-like domain-containing protein [Actinobacteria bacterium]|nr:flippase-like domain-containing protein [Actinomycetota bacterium]